MTRIQYLLSITHQLLQKYPVDMVRPLSVLGNTCYNNIDNKNAAFLPLKQKEQFINSIINQINLNISVTCR